MEFRPTLSRDTGVNLTAADCEELLGSTFKFEGEPVSLQIHPGLFYCGLGEAVENQMPGFVLPNHLKVACYCYRQAAEVHNNPVGMCKLAALFLLRGVMEDPVQAIVWYQKAADVGDAPDKCVVMQIMTGDARAGVAMDQPRGFALLCEAAEVGYVQALFQVARCYLRGDGVEKDAARAVTCLLQLITRDDAATASVTTAQSLLAQCYATGEGVEADTVQAAVWCQRAADGGDTNAIGMLPMIRTCTFCGTTPARKHCERCRKVRYCNSTCQAAHWNREMEPHKSYCRRTAEASQPEAGGGGGSSSSAQ